MPPITYLPCLLAVNDVKKKIQHLRTSFTREARRKKLFRIYNEPGSEQKPMFSKWIHFQRMLFLKDVIEERGLRLQQEMVYMVWNTRTYTPL